jgi:hypothetical protein
VRYSVGLCVGVGMCGGCGVGVGMCSMLPCVLSVVSICWHVSWVSCVLSVVQCWVPTDAVCCHVCWCGGVCLGGSSRLVHSAPVPEVLSWP